MLAFSNDYYGLIFRATQSVELFCAYYEEADSLRSLADELNISLLKLRKLLITADVFTSDICTEINNLHQSEKRFRRL